MGAITTTFVKQFTDNFVMLAQQKMARFKNAVRFEPGIVGEEAYFDQLAPTEVVEANTRHDDTPLVDSDYRRRRVSMRDFRWADLVDSEDKLKQIINPESVLAQNAAAAFNRKIDKLIIDAATGSANTGKTGSTSVPLPSSQKIVHGSAGLSKAKVITASRILNENEVETEDRFIAVSSQQLEDMLLVNEVVSSDFVTVKALINGEIDTWMGFTWIRTEQLNEDATPDRQVIAWQKTGLLLAEALGITTRITERADKNFAVQVFVKMGYGATRMEETKVVEIACEE